VSLPSLRVRRPRTGSPNDGARSAVLSCQSPGYMAEQVEYRRAWTVRHLPHGPRREVSHHSRGSSFATYRAHAISEAPAVHRGLERCAGATAVTRAQRWALVASLLLGMAAGLGFFTFGYARILLPNERPGRVRQLPHHARALLAARADGATRTESAAGHQPRARVGTAVRWRRRLGALVEPPCA